MYRGLIDVETVLCVYWHQPTIQQLAILLLFLSQSNLHKMFCNVIFILVCIYYLIVIIIITITIWLSLLLLFLSDCNHYYYYFFSKFSINILWIFWYIGHKLDKIFYMQELYNSLNENKVTNATLLAKLQRDPFLFLIFSQKRVCLCKNKLMENKNSVRKN